MRRSAIPSPFEEKTMSDSTKFDGWLKDGGPAALVIRELLEPVEGRDGVFFPATFAPSEDKTKFAGGYNIDVFPDEKVVGETVLAMVKDGRLRPTIDLFPSSPNICLVDSVGSQANRTETIFARPEYVPLVPQVTVKAGDKTSNLLEAGHRAGDAIIRSSELGTELQAAFREVLKGNAEPLARIAPTSLVFGVWDSRDTEAKLPRLVASTIRAFNVERLTRSANYLVQQQIDYTKEGLLSLWESEKEKELYSKRGFLNALASASHGGVRLRPDGVIRRDSTLSLAALRRLSSPDKDGTMKTRRYILGIALVALTAEQETYLRQGCNLVPAEEGGSREFEIVHASGKREPCRLTHEDVLSYAKAAATEFGVGPNRDVLFDRSLAEKDIKGDKENVKGEIISVDHDEKKFKLNVGKKNELKAIEVTTNEQTVFMKGKEKSAFDQVVIQGAKLDAEVTNGIAVKVTCKK
jgi:CRISPR-associated protein Csb1